MGDRYPVAGPSQQSMSPLVPGRAPSNASGDVGLVMSIVAAFDRIFAQYEPVQGLDTSVGPRLLAQAENPIYPGGSNAWSWMSERLTLAQNRRMLFREYDIIEDDFPEISSALNIYADNACATDAYSEDIVTISTDDERVGALFSVMKDILKLDKLVWTRAREITRVGEQFDENVFSAETGFIARLKPLPVAYMMRNEDEFGMLPPLNAFSELDESYREVVNFTSWQVTHYRLLRRPDDIYGTGLLYAIRRLAKKLGLAEEALLLARLTRAHKRLVYGIPVDGMAPEQRRKYVNDVKREYRKRRVINPRTQRLDLESNPLASEDDIFLGSTKENEVKIQEISGDPSVGELADIEFWQNKMFSALMVPKSYLGIERDVNAKATLTEQDVQFARTVHRIQVALQEGIRATFDRCLILFGIDPAQVEYSIQFPAISLIDELRSWEIENLKLQAAVQFKEMFFPGDEWMLVNYLGFSQDEALELIANQEAPPEPEPAPAGPAGESEDDDDPLDNELPHPDLDDAETQLRWKTLNPKQRKRRRQLLGLFEQAQQLHVLGQRPKRRQISVVQNADFKKLAAEMQKNGNGHRPRRALSGYSR